MPPAGSEAIRLQKVLSGAGVASRRKAEALIADGRVTVNGRVARLGDRARPDIDDVRVDGMPIALPPGKTYLALHKPAGFVTTTSDPEGRPTVMDLVGGQERVFPVGRLDIDTEGLLLLTDDGDLANRLMHPRYGVAKIYVAEVAGRVSKATIHRLGEGVDIGETRPAKAVARILDARRGGGGATVLEVEVHEGRKRLVRRLLEEAGHPVRRLVRTSVGPVGLGRLAPGSCRNLTREEVASLYGEVGL